MKRTQSFGPLVAYKTAVFIFSSFLLILFVSCKKEALNAEETQNQSYETLIPKINSWLDAQKIGLPASSVVRIDSLKMNLSYGEIHLEKYKDSKEFIVIPVLSSLKSRHNAEKNPISYLVLVYDHQDSITKGNVLQYMSSNGQMQAPQNTFSKIFTYKNLDCSGQFTMLSITDYFLYEIEFENGKLKSVAEQIKRNEEKNSSGRVNGCIDWFLITTIYYYDGGSDTYEQYITTTCDDPCNETRVNGRSYRVNCGGGSGGNTIEYMYALSRPWKWDVQTTENWWAESYETVSGERNNNEPQGGHFTDISHNSSYFATNLPGYTWEEVGHVVSKDNPQRVYATVTGRVTHGAFVATYSNFQFKSFSELLGFGGQ